MDKGKALVVHFSGTGGTKHAAAAIADALKVRGCWVVQHSLDAKELAKYKADYPQLIESIEYLFILYAVHAMDAPTPVYEWIEGLPQGKGLKTVVISVSGGGELWPNTSCRVHCIKALEKKGYDVTYERMMVMPPNVLIGVNDDLCMHLLNATPVKAGRIVEDVLSGKRHRTRFKVSSRWMHFISKAEHKGAKQFGPTISAGEDCTGCGLCAANCPRQNITMESGKPIFHDACVICMRCIYQCPQNAISARKLRLIVIKNGFDIESLQERMKGVELKPVKDCCKGIILAGVKKYLMEKD